MSSPDRDRRRAPIGLGWILNAGLLLCGILLWHNPLAIYASAPEDLEFSGPQIATVLGLLGLGIVLAIGLPLLVLPARSRRLYHAILASLALLVWLYGQVLPVDVGLIDGTALDLSASVGQRVAQVLIFLTAFSAFAWAAWKVPRPIGTAILVLNLGLVANTAYAISRDDKPSVPLDDESPFPPEVYRFGKEKNVLLILMDAMQSDVLADVLAENDDLRRQFTGFTHFKNGMGVARTTYLTMPTVYSGRQYQLGSSIRQHIVDAVEASYLTQLARAGIDTTLVNPMMFYCDRTDVRCVKSTVVQGSPRGRLVNEMGLLLDLSLLRSAPHFLKNEVYRDGHWLLKNLARDDTKLSFAARDNAFLARFAAEAFVDGTAPVVKFIYLSNTHKPTDLDETCRYSPRDFDRETYKTQIRCAMQSLTAVFRSLSELGIYDETAIFVLSDTGVPCCLASHFVPATEREDPWAAKVGAANPSILYKAPGAAGPIRISEAPVQLTDVGATVCDLLEDCTQEEGEPLPDVGENEDRVRRFLYYRWQHEYWERDLLPEVDVYELRGRVYRRADWRSPLASEPSPAPSTPR